MNNLLKDELIEKYNKISINSESNYDIKYKRNNGIYHTDLKLAYFMVEKMFDEYNLDVKKLKSKKILEPCAGVGNFIIAIIIKLYFQKIKINDLIEILKNIYVIEKEKKSIENYKNSMKSILYELYKYEIKDKYFETNAINSSLIFDENNNYIELKKIIDMKFDIIITNPPYKIFKNTNANDSNDYKEKIKITSQKFIYANEGMINYYKLFVEKITTEYANNNAIINLLIPNSFLTDKTCYRLRKHILTSCNLKYVGIIDENNKYVSAQQGLCVILFKNELLTQNIKVEKVSDINNLKDISELSINEIESNSEFYEIIFMTEIEKKIFSNFINMKKIKDCKFIKNLRGELDLTVSKEYITKDKTKYMLIRGRNIKRYDISDESIEYIEEEFINTTNKKNDIFIERIACQQISNMKKENRLNFSIIKPNHILGNSCNYIVVENNEYGIDIYSMLGILNSNIYNWKFKVSSSNNHISNYEIGQLPIILNKEFNIKISNLVKDYLNIKDIKKISEIEEYISNIFSINENISDIKNSENLLSESVNLDFKKNDEENTIVLNGFINDLFYITGKNISIDNAVKILKNNNISEFLVDNINNEYEKKINFGLIEKYKKIQNQEVINNQGFKLSDLDIEMIKNIPCGGNWKFIPQETIEKSQRLKRIQETGGRTTLYGRLDYKKPSYTITTYFNRPGNGTYVHPEYDRVITVREAARLQSFSDEYYFYGNKTELLKQIGNAVPPLLSKSIINKIKQKVDCKNCVDLFCGAGGMSSGFEKEGINILVANDFDKSATITYKINHPKTDVIVGDITSSEIKNKLYNSINNFKDVDIVCGGPPCQGFSLAGKRFIDDPRNELFREFVEIVDKIKPKIMIFENVEGILTFNRRRNSE